MIKVNLSGIRTNDSLNISVAQNGITAGPVSVAAWGGVGGGGTITIVPDRTTLQVAPDSVRFSVDLSEATFDTAGPAGDEIYDARMHDLIYLWDFDDPGTWSAPVNVLAAWKNRSVAKGPYVAHMYSEPGTYNPSVLVVEPSTGKTATATYEVVVSDPDTVYAGANTICVNPVGDNVWAGAPAGSTHVNLDEIEYGTAEWAAQRGETPKRWLFKKGCTFTFGVVLDYLDGLGLALGSYGSGSRPILSPFSDGTNSNKTLTVHNRYRGLGIAETADLRIDGINFVGDFDPTTTLSSTPSGTISEHALRISKQLDLNINNCLFSGFMRSTIELTNSGGNRQHTHLNDCAIMNFGGQYPTFFSPNLHEDVSVNFTGVRIAQNPDAIADTTTRAPVRINHSAKTHMRGCDFFHTDPSQPCLKLAETAEDDGLIVNVHSCSLEGGLWPLTFQRNVTSAGAKRSCVMNAIVDGLVIVGNAYTQYTVISYGSGLTIRNSLLIQPNCVPYNNRHVAFISVGGTGSYDGSIVGAAPVRAYNCTLRSDRSNSDNFGQATITTANAAFTAASLDKNNVIHMPGMTPASNDFAPLTDIQLWTPRSKGYRDPNTLVLDTRYATPPDAVKDTKPKTTPTMSPAIGTALKEPVSYQDILLRKRPEPPSMGAWEVE